MVRWLLKFPGLMLSAGPSGRVVVIVWLGVSLALAAVSPGSAAPPRPSAIKAGTAAVPVAVFGKDERVKLPDRLHNLRGSIGLLYNGKVRTVCSAFCVADAIVATASHCIYKTKGQRPPSTTQFLFSRPGTRLPRSRIAGSRQRAAAQQILAGAIGISTKPPIDAALDWALVRLEQPVCRGHALRLKAMKPKAIEAAASNGQIFQVAFHRDYGNWTLAYADTCRPANGEKMISGKGAGHDFRNPADLILHACDTGGASSGSPLMIAGPWGVEVVAVNVGTFVRSRVLSRGRKNSRRRVRSSAVANTAVSVTAFADKLKLLREADILTLRADLRELQGSLSTMGLYKGPIDGLFGRITRGAITAYEARNGLPSTGLPTSALLKGLKQSPGAPKRSLKPSAGKVLEPPRRVPSR